jgi:hypothetical protein
MRPFVLLLLLAAALQSSAQTYTKTLRPKNGKDLDITMLDSTSANWGHDTYMQHQIDTNRYYACGTELSLKAWTWQGCPGWQRLLICFADLKNPAVIPANATITSATLTLYSPSSSPGNYGNSVYPGTPYGDSNNAWVYQLADTFNEHTITWRNQVGILHNDSVRVPVSTQRFNDSARMNVTAMAQNMHANINTGFEVRLDTEVLYRSWVFCNSRHADSTRYPKLVVTYTVPAGVEQLINSDLDVSLYPNPATDQLYLDVNLNANGMLYTGIRDLSGRMVLEQTKAGRKGLNQLAMPLGNLAKGMYLLEVSDGSGKFRRTFVKI